MRAAVTHKRGVESPFDREWIQNDLAEYAQRARNGESDEDLQNELIAELLPWALRAADYMARKLPSSADTAAVQSEVTWELLQSVRRIDWRRYDRWPGLLKARIRGAGTAVYRSEDVLSRGQRAARRKFLEREDIMQQQRGRTLTSAERNDIAKEIAPRGGITLVLTGGNYPISLEFATQIAHPSANPEEESLVRMRVQAVRKWLTSDVPEEVATQVVNWLEQGGNSLDRALRRRIAAYLPQLIERLP